MVMLSVLVLVLATPTLNPILAFCETCGIPPFLLSSAALVFLLHTVIADIQNVAYYGLRIFFHSMLSIFFRSIEVVGADNIPAKGPVIFTGNHSNQFVDGLMVLCHARHKIGFLIAQSSYDKPIIGDCAKLAGCIPVMRPQDAAKKGTGMARFDGTLVVRGEGTKFLSEIAPGDKLRPRNMPQQLKVEQVISDTELRLASMSAREVPDFSKGIVGTSALAVVDDPASTLFPYDCLARVDQGQVFSKVLQSLRAGRCLGIFPEGGSHDQTDLLPLKPGVAIIALEAFQKHKLNVPIVPVGLSYFEGHEFRGRCVVEFGPPISLTPELFKEYGTDKRAATGKVLELVEEGLRGCLVTAPTYEDLELVYMVRRLYSRDSRLTATQKQDLNRRFAFWYCNFLLRKQAANELPSDLQEMVTRVRDYRDQLKLLGLKDYQVRHLDNQPLTKTLLTLLHMIFLFLLALFPNVLLNLPVGVFARLTADKHQKEALAKSNVKLTAKDVRLSKMITVCMSGVPALWLGYAFIMLVVGFPVRTTVLVFFCFPFFSYLGVIAAESGMVDFKDMRPVLLRLMVNRDEMLKLIKVREGLQREVRALVRKYGPQIGEVYTADKVAWGSIPKGFLSELNLSEAGAATAPASAPTSTGQVDAAAGAAAEEPAAKEQG